MNSFHSSWSWLMTSTSHLLTMSWWRSWWWILKSVNDDELELLNASSVNINNLGFIDDTTSMPNSPNASSGIEIETVKHSEPAVQSEAE